MGLMNAKVKEIELPPVPDAKQKPIAPPEEVPVLADAVSVSGGNPLFLYPALQQRLLTLLHMVDQGKAIILVIGDFGSGKSTLAEHCEQKSWQDRRLVHISAVQEYTVRNLVKTVASATGVENPNITFQALCKHLTNHSDTLDHLLVIDDAHNLSQDNLRALICLKKTLAPKSAKFDIVLFSEPDIKQSLTHGSLLAYSDGWANFIYLPRMNEQDVALYVEERLIHCGYTLRKPGSKQLKQIHQSSAGLPIRINEMLAREVLDRKDRSILHGAKTSIRRSLLLLVLLAAVAGLFHQQNELRILLAKWFDVYTFPKPAAIKPGGTIVLPAPQALEPAAAPADSLEGKLTLDPDQAFPEDPNTPEEQLTVSMQTTAMPISQSAPATSDIDTPALIDDSLPVATLASQESLASALAAAPQTSTATRDPLTALKRLAGNTWLQTQDPKAYTIQLTGAYNAEVLAQFIRRLQLNEGIAYLQLVINDYDWHIVIQGIYKNSTEAQQALETLPPEIKNLRPWIRRIGSLQELLAR